MFGSSRGIMREGQVVEVMDWSKSDLRSSGTNAVFFLVIEHWLIELYQLNTCARVLEEAWEFA